ncbi:hypothetical protein JEQ12_004403 [Ovis aries]|uniref:Uncharacterized protein n=1 Tax=Ovis aries TaxID=9940 RepID=A0A836A7K0_SHEEP|nr:hypothetical protein JEQ12_004403 [Ovis aries]
MHTLNKPMIWTAFQQNEEGNQETGKGKRGGTVYGNPPANAGDTGSLIREDSTHCGATKPVTSPSGVNLGEPERQTSSARPSGASQTQKP